MWWEETTHLVGGNHFREMNPYHVKMYGYCIYKSEKGTRGRKFKIFLWLLKNRFEWQACE